MSSPSNLGPALLARWDALLPTAPDVGRDLVRRYAAPTRRYHDLRHLTEVVDAVEVLGETARDLDAVRLAAWFHDAVYDTHRPDNEEASATLAERLLPAHGVDPDRVAEVARLVRLTVDHQPAPDDANGAVLCDADLAILAADPARYGEYAASVREEYAHVDDAAFRQGRTTVLERLLHHDPLFHTAHGRETWERRARHNLRTELALLRG
jgi:predicted metal-dependent HD superfamily phosphohydrolase